MSMVDARAAVHWGVWFPRGDRIAHHTVLFGPRYQGLLEDIFTGPQLPADYSLYLHGPTVTDPSLAPSGCDAFYVLSPVPHLGHAPLDWPAIAPAYADPGAGIPGVVNSAKATARLVLQDFAL